MDNNKTLIAFFEKPWLTCIKANQRQQEAKINMVSTDKQQTMVFLETNHHHMQQSFAKWSVVNLYFESWSTKKHINWFFDKQILWYLYTYYLLYSNIVIIMCSVQFEFKIIYSM